MKFHCFYIRLFALSCMSATLACAVPFRSAEVMAMKGSASIEVPGQEPIPLTEGTIVREGDSIVSEKDGVLHLVFSNGIDIMIYENTHLVISKFEQKPFWKSDPNELLTEEVSRSKTVIELKHGNIKGNAKSLRDDSEFRVRTEMGEASVSQDLFFIELYYSPLRNSFVLNVQNIEGMIDLISKFSGSVDFKENGMAVKSFNPKSNELQLVRIPEKKTFSVRKPQISSELRSYVQQFPKDVTSRLILNFGDADNPYPDPPKPQMTRLDKTEDFEPEMLIREDIVLPFEVPIPATED